MRGILSSAYRGAARAQERMALVFLVCFWVVGLRGAARYVSGLVGACSSSEAGEARYSNWLCRLFPWCRAVIWSFLAVFGRPDGALF